MLIISTKDVKFEAKKVEIGKIFKYFTQNGKIFNKKFGILVNRSYICSTKNKQQANKITIMKTLVDICNIIKALEEEIETNKDQMFELDYNTQKEESWKLLDQRMKLEGKLTFELIVWVKRYSPEMWSDFFATMDKKKRAEELRVMYKNRRNLGIHITY